MPGDGLLEEARGAYAARDWVTARRCFAEAAADEDLLADDLAARADALWWLGELDEALPIQQEAYRAYLAGDEPARAAMMALEVGYTWGIRGDEARASGWMSRAARLLEGQPEGPEHGFLRYIDFEVALSSSHLDTAEAVAREVHAMGQRFADADLIALGVMSQGRVLVRRGVLVEGMALLDEAMVAAVSDDLNPGWAGNIYCHLMVVCYEIADLKRAGEWTEATASWCEAMPGAGPFMGICRMHRAQLLVIRGEWDTAEREARRVCDELVDFDVAVAAEAHYQIGEVRRQRGDQAGAEEAYRTAHGLGRDPQPGIALLRLAQGRVSDALTGITSALSTRSADPLLRVQVLPAAVEVALAAGDLVRARSAADELDDVAGTYGTAGRRAEACTARGALLIAEGRARDAVALLRDAVRAWQRLEAPYETARTRLLLARALEAVGDRDSARLERDAAGDALNRLNASTAMADATAPRIPRADGLTRREAQILGMLAAGRTNQKIADELVLSIRTVERHLATVYRKLDLQGRSARAAAVRYALDEGIAEPRGSA